MLHTHLSLSLSLRIAGCLLTDYFLSLIRAQGDDYRDDISAVVCYLKGPDGTVANEALRQALDAHGPKTLGADLGGKDDESEEDEEKPADGAAAAATADDTKATRSKQFEQKRLSTTTLPVGASDVLKEAAAPPSGGCCLIS